MTDPAIAVLTIIMVLACPTSFNHHDGEEITDVDLYIAKHEHPLDDRDQHNGPPTLVHKLKSRKSVLTLAVSSSRIYAGTQGGEILVSTLSPLESTLLRLV